MQSTYMIIVPLIDDVFKSICGGGGGGGETHQVMVYFLNDHGYDQWKKHVSYSTPPAPVFM